MECLKCEIFWYPIFHAVDYIQIQIVHNILGQFIAHTLATVTLTKHINFMSIGFLVVALVLKIDFASSNNQANRHIQLQIVHNILGQLIAHTLATVTFNKRISFMSIGFLVVALVLIDDDN